MDDYCEDVEIVSVDLFLVVFLGKRREIVGIVVIGVCEEKGWVIFKSGRNLIMFMG